ncbi:oxygenase MpaB family protein [Rhodococcus sp. CX]|uniref:oxygenase MpaB family protein n=1 Tax=Rhodococcus sp. CX TaxID=2789880 RepID=UPI0027DAD2B2|nr:oxygenase MpaB family protein [Rhodococcus sp. CX]
MTIEAPLPTRPTSIRLSTSRLHDRADRLAPKPILSEGAPRLAMSLLVGDSVRPTRAQARAFARFANTCDPVADDLVAAMRRDRTRIRAQFEQALEHGIETVDDPAPEVQAFIDALDDVPFWVDYDKLDLAAQAIARMPVSTLLAFTTAIAFPASYVSPRVNDVLLRGGDLAKRAAARIVETVSWSMDCTAPGGMERFGEGTKNTARVRVVHAYIRAGIDRVDDWNTDTHGRPVNQLHYCVTMIPIAGVALAVMAAGHWYSRRERDAIVHLYRYVAHTMGVTAELQVTSLDELLRLIWLAVWSEVDPDDSSRALTDAALKAVPRIYGVDGPGPANRIKSWAYYHFHADLARLSLGSGYSDAVGIPRLSPMAALYPLWFARNLVRDRLSVAVPGGAARAARRGHRERMRAVGEVKQRLDVRPYERDGAVHTVGERDRELRAGRTR